MSLYSSASTQGRIFALTLALLHASLSPLAAEAIRGALGKGDPTLDSGEYFEEHSFEGSAGSEVRISLSSSDFDSYLILISPSGERWENDDDPEGQDGASLLTQTLPEDGAYQVYVTSYASGEIGNFTLEIEQTEGTAAGLPSGVLDTSDPTLVTGEYYDVVQKPVTAGESLVVDLESTAFDPYLIIRWPDGTESQNDDHEGSSSHSHLTATAPASGVAEILVTTYSPGSTGEYALRINGQSGINPDAPVASAVETVQGELSSNDDTLANGEFFDAYTFQGLTGQNAVIELSSSAFDTYLVLVSPDGSYEENDDYESDQSRSRIELTLPTDGEYTIWATSYSGGETGSYTLSYPGAPTGVAIGTGAVAGETVGGRLESGDRTLQSGEYEDRYTFEGESGQAVTIDLHSTEFDPYLMLIAPSDEQEENDDYEGDTTRSRIDTTLAESGTYTVSVTSYSAGETGAYVLTYPGAEGALSTGTPSGSFSGTVGGNQTVTGRLQPGDITLSSGEFEDIYSFEATAGDSVQIDLRSDEFDPYLLLIAPSGEQEENDDHEGSGSHSRIVWELPETGTYRVGVTSYEVGETGEYTLSYPANGAAGNAVDTNIERFNGELSSSDRQLDGGEFLDRHEIEGRAGERLVIDLRSEDFDPYLILMGPDGEQEDNDDHEGSQSWSQIVTTLTADGTYSIGVTSYEKKQTGTYRLTVTRHRGDAESQSRSQSVSGSLENGDDTLDEGEFYDRIPVAMVPGNHLQVSLSSSAFDTFLAILTPSGEILQNDDCEGSTNESCLDHEATEEGEYTIVVTSYKGGETGDYVLEFTIDEVDTSAATNRQDTVRLEFGQPAQGDLSEGDPKLETGEHRDIYFFDGTPGETVTVELTSSAFDSYVGIITPSGESIENDDFEGDTSLSKVELPIVEEGRYRVVATSYAAGETGAYTLKLNRGMSTPTQSYADQLVNGNGDTGESRIFGIFMGIADYPGEVNDLPYTDRDAQTVFNAMRDGAGMRPSDGVILQNSAATKQAFINALNRVAREADSNDTLVIFYSGHGAQYPRRNGYESADPDGKDESLELYDAPILDNELNDLLNNVNVGCQFLVFDACFSGGFAKDVISRPGRMGLFSSEEDVTSAVAAKFAAGGYLSVFFSDTIMERYADSDANGELCALEISHYISERYRAQVKSTNYVSTSDNLGYQRLVVDRGSIGPYQTVFKRR
jgi:hypothetical protein